MYARIVEYGAPAELKLTPDQVATLVTVSGQWQRALRLARTPLEVESTATGAIVRARDVAGFVRAGTVSLDVIPKFLSPDEVGPSWRVCLWRLLAFASGIDSIQVSTLGIESEENGIADLLADVFLSGIQSSPQLGLPLGYRPERRLSQFLTGRLDAQRIGHLVRPDGLVPVVSQRLTRDTDYGRLLRWASLQLSDMVDSSERRQRLRAWAATLPEVQPAPPAKFHSHLVARQFPHLAPAFQVAEILLRERWGNFGPGSLNVPGFLWRSETLFERAMLRLVQRSTRLLGLSADKRQHTLATKSIKPGIRSVSTTPDITVYRGNMAVTILDSKYKVLADFPSNDDIYQVLSGGRVTAAAQAALLYPAANSGISVQTLIPEGSGYPNSLDIISVGLASFSSPQALRETTLELSQWLRSATGVEAS